MIDRATVDKILDAADIVDVVSDFVHLRRRGANYVGLCPFHNEKTPSFSVSRSKGICKCFSCGKGGSAVNFVMEHEQMSYYEALKYLAKKYHIEVKERELTDSERQAQSERENMLLVNEFALKHFEDNLFNTEEGRSIGLSYFYERQFTDATIKKFHLGYSLEKRDDLFLAIKANSLNPEYAVNSGLCINGERGIYDRFKGRVMFPVLNIAGKVIAFGGRTLKKDIAKYVNSPESLIYKKKNELYGLYQAKQAIVKKDKCFLVEGYTDVLSMHQAGIENVVASSGTSLTEGQIRMIHRFTENITVLYDGDAAGIKASLRGIDLLLAEGLNVKVLLLPDGDDPDSFAKKHNASEFQDFISQNETDFIRFKTQILLSGLENDPVKKAVAISDIVKSISVIPNDITRSVYIKECSIKFDIQEKILSNEVKKAIDAATEKAATSRGSFGNPSEIESQPKEVGPNVETQIVISKQPSQQLLDNENPMRFYETDTIRLITKFGMCCGIFEIADASGNPRPITIVEAINLDLTSEGLMFTDPTYKKIFDYTLSVLDVFYNDRANKIQQLEQKALIKKREGIEHIRLTIDDFNECQKEEEKLMQRIAEEQKTEIIEYESLFLQHRLCSDPDDIIRKEALDLIAEKETLSKVHTKHSQVLSDYDRLKELVSSALNVWKDGVIDLRIKQIQSELSNNPGIEEAERLLLEQARLRMLRSQLITDRVIIP